MTTKKVFKNVIVPEKAWHIAGFQLFHFKCISWMREEKVKRRGKFALEFWVSNERFPVARFSWNDVVFVELFYYPQTQTAACLSGKALHDSKEVISCHRNLLNSYFEARFPNAPKYGSSVSKC